MKKLILLTDIRRILKHQIAWKSAQWKPSCSMRTDGEDGQIDMTKLNSRFSQILPTPLKRGHLDFYCTFLSMFLGRQACRWTKYRPKYEYVPYMWGQLNWLNKLLAFISIVMC